MFNALLKYLLDDLIKSVLAAEAASNINISKQQLSNMHKSDNL